MDYEKKYKEALELAKVAAFNGHQSLMEGIFPELAESEDEKIRKDIIDFVRHSVNRIPAQKFNKYIVWLEKQGTTTDINPSEFDLRLNKLLKQFETLPKEELVNCLSFYLNTVQNDGIYKRAENPADKIEPKFNVGDWVVNTVGDTNQVVKVLYDGYTLDDNTFISNSWATQHYHLWTIADAKEGDVLAISWWEDNNFWEKTIIFKKYHNKGVQGLYSSPCVEGYGSTFENGKLAFNEEVPYYSKTWTCNLHPATKEQRDLLFQKMHEAGYEWDAEKKELKKIEQKPAWSKEDKEMFDKIRSIVEKYAFSQSAVDVNGDLCEKEYIEADNWLNSLKERIGE